MTKYSNKFFTILESSLDPENEADAFANELDEGTSPDSLGATDAAADAENINAKVSSAIQQQARIMEETIMDWVSQFEDFLELLNGTSPGSIQSQLATSEADTILDRMKQSEQRKIARVATELAALTESFKGYLAQSENTSFKYV